MFVKMSFSAILFLFMLGACVIPFALDFWGSTPPSITSESSTQNLSQGRSSTASATTIAPHNGKQLNNPSQPLMVTDLTPKYDLEPESIYILQIGSPVWLTNFAHPERGCNWLGVAGQVFTIDNIPTRNLVIEVGGLLEGREVVGIGLTGLETMYGDGGYEIVLSNHVVDSSQMIWIQVQDLKGQDLSKKIFFDTFADCERNLILINFTQSQNILNEFVPILINQP